MAPNLGGDGERNDRDNVQVSVFGNLEVPVRKFRRRNSFGKVGGNKGKDV